MRVAVVGSRDFDNYELLKQVLDKLQITVVVSGGANGADKLAEQYAAERNIPTDIHYAEWGLYGKRAGFIRNVQIWDNADIGVAFWDGVSRGTKHSFDLAKKQKKKLLVIEYNTDKQYIIEDK